MRLSPSGLAYRAFEPPWARATRRSAAGGGVAVMQQCVVKTQDSTVLRDATAEEEDIAKQLLVVADYAELVKLEEMTQGHASMLDEQVLQLTRQLASMSDESASAEKTARQQNVMDCLKAAQAGSYSIPQTWESFDELRLRLIFFHFHLFPIHTTIHLPSIS